MNTKTREGASAGRNLRCLEICLLLFQRGKKILSKVKKVFNQACGDGPEKG